MPILNRENRSWSLTDWTDEGYHIDVTQNSPNDFTGSCILAGGEGDKFDPWSQNY